MISYFSQPTCDDLMELAGRGTLLSLNFFPPFSEVSLQEARSLPPTPFGRPPSGLEGPPHIGSPVKPGTSLRVSELSVVALQSRGRVDLVAPAWYMDAKC